MIQLIEIIVAARSSPLSKKQVEEVQRALYLFHPQIQFLPEWIITSGDIDKITPLSQVMNEDFFTKEIDDLLLQRKCRIAIHSAKDLPKSLKKGLKIVAITEGVDSRDSLIIPHGYTLDSMKSYSRIGTSSSRRDEALKKIHPSFIPIPIRGTIEERISLLHEGKIDGLIIAEAALIRLKLLDLNRIILDIPTEPLQGKLAIVAHSDDHEMCHLFSCLDTRSNKKEEEMA